MDAKYDSIMFSLIKFLFIKEDFFDKVIYWQWIANLEPHLFKNQ